MKPSDTILRHLTSVWLLLLVVLCTACAPFSGQGPHALPGEEAEGDAFPDDAEPDAVVGEIELYYLGTPALPAGAEKALLSLMTESYRCLADLEEPDLLSHFDLQRTASRRSAHVNQLACAYLVAVRKAQEADLRWTNHDGRLDVVRTEETAQGVFEVVFVEHSRVNYAFLGDVDTHASNVEHQMELSYIGGRWRITRHEKAQDVHYLAEEAYASLDGGDPAAHYDALLSTLTAHAAESIGRNREARRAFLADPAAEGRITREWEHDYDRQAAVAYARTWVGTDSWRRNPAWQAYDEQGGNCNNFISQCLHAGGIPMDAQGHTESQWKWLGDRIDGRERLSGRSASWCGVDEFYRYAAQNQGAGLVAQLDANLYSGRIGDIIQYGAGGEWNHSVIITDVIRDERGRIVDYLIHSNTTDRIDCPMSAYAYTDVRLIRILGYNGQ